MNSTKTYWDFHAKVSKVIAGELSRIITKEYHITLVKYIKRLNKFEEKLIKLEAAIDLKQKSVVKRLRDSLDLEMEIFKRL